MPQVQRRANMPTECTSVCSDGLKVVTLSCETSSKFAKTSLLTSHLTDNHSGNHISSPTSVMSARQ